MFKDGMMGSQGKGKGKQATERPGLEDLGEVSSQSKYDLQLHDLHPRCCRSN